MIWQAPWAWLGLLTIALPVLIHLLGQGNAPRLPFPTLQFLGITRPLPNRRTRLHDLVLLAVRIAILAAAVAALARPLWLTATRTNAANTSLVRAIIVDTSASMRRSVPGGGRAIDAALRSSRQLADSATTAVVLRVASPSRAVTGALAWLGRRPGRAELVIVSDFQAGTVDSSDLAAIPPEVGIRFVPVAVEATATPLETQLQYGATNVTAHIAIAPDQTDVDWTTAKAGAGEHIALLTGPASASSADAARRAAETIGVPLPIDTGRHIAMVYPDYPGRATLLQHATRIQSPWMADIVAAIRADGTLRTAASTAAVQPPDDTANTLTVVTTRAGIPAILAAADSADGQERLLLLVRADAGSPASAALIAATRRALSTAVSAAELDPATVPLSTLNAWQRPATVRSVRNPDADISDGRWFWLVALLLLGVETVLRRGRSPSGTSEVAHDAAAG